MSAGQAPRFAAVPPGPVADADAVLRAVTALSDDAIFTCDPDGVVSSWSPTAERLLGCPSGEVLGLPLPELVPAHLRSDAQAVVASAGAGELVRRFETEVLRPDGMPVLVSVSICPLPGPFGAAGLVVVVRDVTEQRLAQAALGALEARLEESEANSHVGSWLWDLRTGVVQWSAQFHQIHGLDPLAFEGTFEAHVRVIHPSDRVRVQAALEACVASGRSTVTDYRVIRPDGLERLLRVRAAPTMGSAGVAVGLRGTGRDVTDEPGGLSPGPPAP